MFCSAFCVVQRTQAHESWRSHQLDPAGTVADVCDGVRAVRRSAAVALHYVVWWAAEEWICISANRPTS